MCREAKDCDDNTKRPVGAEPQGSQKNHQRNYKQELQILFCFFELEINIDLFSICPTIGCARVKIRFVFEECDFHAAASRYFGIIAPPYDIIISIGSQRYLYSQLGLPLKK